MQKTDFVTIPGLPSIPREVWEAQKQRILACRNQRAAGFGDGSPQYEQELERLKKCLRDAGMRLGHVTALEEEIALC